MDAKLYEREYLHNHTLSLTSTDLRITFALSTLGVILIGLFV